ncbi:hypothetical protein CK203_066203 [Vitis vinifera]|uniref:DUF659 domain-containing protein n=1 Tax=Vitis vinifera TaxID=29760 RepID=A0A438FNM7_VITVI|nr:hypothetical protein CK203_066203 [Vitis vinifera]
MNIGSEYVNEDLFGLEDEDIGEEINSRTNVTNISSGGSNRGGSGGRTFSSKKPRQKEARERACTLITRWMYEAAIPFNAITYPSFQPMIEVIGQYGVGMKDQLFMRKERTLVNFLVNCSKGTMFMQSIDASSMIKTGEKMFELLDKWVEQVGEENVIQVITDNHSSYVDGRLLELKRPHLYWTPCAAHCLDLILEDIGKLPNIKRTLERAISLNGLSLQLLSSHYRDCMNKKQFEEDVYKLRLVSGPLVRVLRLVDGEKKAPMGYIYEAMNRAKDAIVRSFNGMKRSTKKSSTSLIRGGRFSFIGLCMQDPAKQEKVVAEVSLFTNAQGLFGNELAVRTRKTRVSAEWWAAYGASAPICKTYEFLQIHSKRRNRLDHQRLNDLVYIKYNRALKRRYNERNTIDPISLKDIDDSNEWLIGRMEDEDSHGGAQDDFVFDDDNLTWGDVARAAGAEEARFDTRARARASSSIIPPIRGIASSSRTLPSYSLIDEDEDGDMVDSADEEDGKATNVGAPHFTKACALDAPCASGSRTTLRLGAP